MRHPCKVHANNHYVTTCAVARSKVGGPLSNLLHSMESASLLMKKTHSMKQDYSYIHNYYITVYMTMLQNRVHLQLEFTNPYVIIMQLHINVAFSSTPMCYESFCFLPMHSTLFVTNKYNTNIFHRICASITWCYNKHIPYHHLVSTHKDTLCDKEIAKYEHMTHK